MELVRGKGAGNFAFSARDKVVSLTVPQAAARTRLVDRFPFVSNRAGL